ncbi:anti-sigma factor [Roseibium sp. Sym1]|uniref:anti-sigma factor n=1 Tax=Roseibium sp. Sym1 TaxID=3016006 RepID=UPI0022B2CF59|nr:anti-sigma factor [Roseibium sp. Sym1]
MTRTANRNLAELADEFVIGLCDPEEQREVEQRLTSEPDLAVHVELARQRFAALDAATPEIEVPAALWSRIEDRLNASGATTSEDNAASRTSTAVTDLAVERAKRRGPLVWTTLASLAASLVLAIALVWNLTTAIDPKVVAVLVNDDGQPVAMIEGTETNTTLVTLLGDTDVPAGSVLQLWTKPDPDGPPVSVGVFDEPKQTLLEAVGLPAPTTDQLYEITFEQPGGSPTGLPTGPILGKGFTREPQ